LNDNKTKNLLTLSESDELFDLLKSRFEKNMHRHQRFDWRDIQRKLGKLWTLNEMQKTGGEPDVVGYDKSTEQYIFCDCFKESPKGRRSLCYDREALNSRKENKPKHSAIGMADEMGIQILSDSKYRELKKLEISTLKLPVGFILLLT
jgi:hypothetical protein